MPMPDDDIEMRELERSPLLNRKDNKKDLSSVSLVDLIEIEKEAWLEAIKTAKTVDALEILKNQMMECSEILAQYDPIRAADWAETCEKAHVIRAKYLPQVALIKNTMWPIAGLAIAGMGLAIVFAPALALASVAVGVTALGYGIVSAIQKHHVVEQYKEEKQSEEIQKKAVASRNKAMRGVVLGIVLVLAVTTGLFPPAAVLTISLIACIPAIRAVAGGINKYFKQKKEIEMKQRAGLQKIQDFKQQLNQFKSENKKENQQEYKNILQDNHVMDNHFSEKLSSGLDHDTKKILSEEKGLNVALDEVLHSAPRHKSAAKREDKKSVQDIYIRRR